MNTETLELIKTIAAQRKIETSVIIEDLEQALVNIQLSAENIKGQEYTMPRSVTDMPIGGNAS